MELELPLTDEESAELRHVAEREHRSPEDVALDAIRLYVRRPVIDHAADEQRRLGGLSAMAEYEHEHGPFTSAERGAAAARVEELVRHFRSTAHGPIVAPPKHDPHINVAEALAAEREEKRW